MLFSKIAFGAHPIWAKSGHAQMSFGGCTMMADPYDFYDSPELITRIKELYEDPAVRIAHIHTKLNEEYAAEKGIDLRISPSRVETHIKNLVEAGELVPRAKASHSFSTSVLKAASELSKTKPDFCAIDIVSYLRTTMRRPPTVKTTVKLLKNSDLYIRADEDSQERADKMRYKLRGDTTFASLVRTAAYRLHQEIGRFSAVDIYDSLWLPASARKINISKYAIATTLRDAPWAERCTGQSGKNLTIVEYRWRESE